ncbi:unnamed protein product [Schistocephalus solidus]|uniref:Reverse transcriptase domain-containing protein n=1 Tax=Schistocephalus solidus TaxID=70667 RepID=A0A183T8U4_SCHSO|nr:unnamed protein product [Schistocephalus solidus]
MPISTEQLMSNLQQQQAQIEAAHLKMMESTMQQFSWHFPDPESSGKQFTSADAVVCLHYWIFYDPDSGVTFDAWFKCCEDIFRVEFAKADDAWKSPRDAESRTRLLTRPRLYPTELTAECQRLKNLKHDSAILEQASSSVAASSVHAVTHTKSMSPRKPQRSITRKPLTACWQCGDCHFVRFCSFKKHVCQNFHQRGHKEDQYSAGQPSESTVLNRMMRHPKRSSSHFYPKSHSIVATFRADFEAWRKYLKVIINGKAVRLQLYTASDTTLISKRTWPLIGRPSMITSNKMALNVSGGTFQLMGSGETRELLVINSHRALFQFSRFPFGVDTARVIFQQTMDTMLKGTEGAAAYPHVILFTASNPDELLQRLETFLTRIQGYSFRLRLDKCTFVLPSMKHIGFIIDQDGRHPDPDNIDAIK